MKKSAVYLNIALVLTNVIAFVVAYLNVNTNIIFWPCVAVWGVTDCLLILQMYSNAKRSKIATKKIRFWVCGLVSLRAMGIFIYLLVTAMGVIVPITLAGAIFDTVLLTYLMGPQLNMYFGIEI